MKTEFMMNKIFCCAGFQHRVEAAGQRGIAVLVHKTSSGIMFLFQSRGIAFEDTSKIGPMPGTPDIKINISCEAGLQYCPWCGRLLQELIEVSPKAFDELAEKHKMFYTGP
jgi:hypothetical protein